MSNYAATAMKSTGTSSANGAMHGSRAGVVAHASSAWQDEADSTGATAVTIAEPIVDSDSSIEASTSASDGIEEGFWEWKFSSRIRWVFAMHLPKLQMC